MVKKPRFLFFNRLLMASLLAASATTSVATEEDRGELSASFRSFYFDRDKSGGLPNSTALTQALMLRYHSPYLGEVVGFDASWFGNLKLHGEDGEGGTDLLRDLEDGSQASYAKLGEALVKFKLPYKGSLDIGRMEVYTPLLNESDFRGTPTTTQAGLFNLGSETSRVYGLVSDKGSAYTETEFYDYADINGDSFKVYVIGAEYRAESGLYLEAALGRAENIMDKAYLNARYNWQAGDDFSLLFDAYQYYGEANGEGALFGVGPDYRSGISNIATQLTAGNSRWTLSYQRVSGDDYQITWDGADHDDTTYASWHSVQRLNFDRGGENSWQLRFDYDFVNLVPGLHAMARYIYGDDIDHAGGSSGSEWERDIDFAYRVPGVENLELRWRYAVVRSTETYDSDEHRLIVNYQMNLF